MFRSRNQRIQKPQKGFTIIELLVATTVFSIILLIATAGILQISRTYYQGVLQARTQETARTIADEIGESMRFSIGSYAPGAVVNGPDIDASNSATGYFCLGTRRYTYAIDRQLKASPNGGKQKAHVLWVDQPVGGCGSAENLDSPVSDGRELLSENMRLTRLSIQPAPGALPDTYRIDIGVAYGDDDLLDFVSGGQTKYCKEAATGREFCAVSNVSLTVTKRL